MKEILINVEDKETRTAVLMHKKLSDLTVERKKTTILAGNIYRGKVTNILGNIQSAFIDIGEDQNGFVHISDIIENTQKFKELYDMEFDWDSSPEEEDSQADIAKLLKPDQTVLVQVVKESIGSKGARLTSNLSIPGRYLVLLPNSPHRGVSRKITDRGARDRLKAVIRAFELPGNMGLICRTASVFATDDQLLEEAQELALLWSDIMDKFNSASGPECIYQESDVLKRALMTALDKNMGRILIDHHPTFLLIQRMFEKYKDENDLKVEYYRDKVPMFKRFNVEREIEKALQRKVWLTKGGYLYFDRTEAMHTIDVNSGKSSSSSKQTNLEESIVQINMEAAEEIARQIRIRNIGGLIIIDFIDMRLRKNQKRVLERFKDALKEDSMKWSILGMNEFGLVEMTRQRSRQSLAQTLHMDCPYCSGNGTIQSLETTAIELERSLREAIVNNEQFALDISLHPSLNEYLDVEMKQDIMAFASKHYAKIHFVPNDLLHLNSYKLYSMLNGEEISV